MNAHRFRLPKRLRQETYSIPIETVIALMLWAFDEEPVHYRWLAPGMSESKVKECLAYFRAKPSQARVVAHLRFGCTFKETCDVETAKAIVKKAMEAERDRAEQAASS